MSAAIRVTVGNRRKFRNQTSENIDRWKSRGGKRQRKERREKICEQKESEERTF